LRCIPTDADFVGENKSNYFGTMGGGFTIEKK